MQVDKIKPTASRFYGLQDLGEFRRQHSIVFDDRCHSIAAINQLLHAAAMAKPATDFTIGQRIGRDLLPSIMIDQRTILIGYEPAVGCFQKIEVHPERLSLLLHFRPALDGASKINYVN